MNSECKRHEFLAKLFKIERLVGIALLWVAIMWMGGNRLIAADQPPTQADVARALLGMPKEMQVFGNRFLDAIAKKDNDTISKLIKTDNFGIMVMTTPDIIMAFAVQYENYVVLDALLSEDAYVNPHVIDVLIFGRKTALHMAVWGDDTKTVGRHKTLRAKSLSNLYLGNS